MKEPNIEAFSENYRKITEAVHSVIVGHSEVVDILCAGFFSGGHVLLEGVPGLGKTLLASSFAKLTSLEFKKIQFTPDLMPADITGTHIITEKEGQRVFEFRKGPLFGNIILADEINRATPKTQSALLEGMQEGAVTSGRETVPLPDPFMVIGTQNPVEMKGTYPLPEAQKDRFMFKADLVLSGEDDIAEILKRTTGSEQPVISTGIEEGVLDQMRSIVRDIAVSDHLRRLAARIILMTHPSEDSSPDIVKKYVRSGVSVRGAQAVIAGSKFDAAAHGRVNADENGVRSYIFPALRHRIVLNFEAGADGVSEDEVLAGVVDSAGIKI